MGSGLDVWGLVQMAEDFGSPERLLGETQLSERQLRIALAYRPVFPDEIDELIAEDRRPLAELRALYPFIEVAAGSDE